jgi:hypothetical protein
MSTLDAAVFTWVRTRTQPGRLTAATGSPTLSRPQNFAAVFDAGDKKADWQRPWMIEKEYNYYWAHNLGQNYRDATADRAWKRQVPLREKTPPLLTTSLPGVTLKTNRFLFPGGSGVTVEAEVTGTFNAGSLLGLAASLAKDTVISMPGSAKPRALAAVLSDLLDGLDKQTLGAVPPDVVGELSPLTVATVTARSDWPSTPIEQDNALHRLLEGLCTMSPAPLNGAVTTLATVQVAGASSNPGTVRLRVGRGRAIWLQNQTSAQDQKRLTCYHHNLSMATMQTSVMLDAVRWASGQPAGSLSQAVRALLRQVVTVLSLLYGKVDDMYASRLVRSQIEESGLVPQLSKLRIDLGVSSQPFT